MNSHQPRTGFSKKTIALSIVIGILSFVGPAHIMVRSSVHGLTMYWDSIEYLSTAENIADGVGILNYSYSPYTGWPLFYPLLLAAINLGGFSVVDAGRLVNIVAFGLIILFTGYWLNRYTQSRLLVIAATVLVMISHTTNHFAFYHMTEILFVLLVLLSLAQISGFLESKNPSIKYLVLSGLFASLAAITRYIGIAVIVTVAFLILIDGRFSILKRIKCAAVYSIISSLPLAVNLVYSRVSTGSYAGLRTARQPLSVLVGDLFDSLSVGFYASDPKHLWFDTNYRWFSQPPRFVSYFLWIAVILIAILCLLIYRYMYHKDGVIVKKLENHYRAILPVLPFVIFTLIYIPSVILAADFWSNSPINIRYIVPIYVPSIISAAFLLDRLLYKAVEGWVYIIKLSLIALLTVSCIIHINSAVRWNVATTSIAIKSEGLSAIKSRGQSVYGYSRYSPIVGYLNANRLDGNVFTNHHSALFRLTDIRSPVSYIPEGDFTECMNWVRSIAEPAGSMGSTYIVYFTSDILANPLTCDPRELDSYSQALELVTETSDGVIYGITTSSDY